MECSAVAFLGASFPSGTAWTRGCIWVWDPAVEWHGPGPGHVIGLCSKEPPAQTGWERGRNVPKLTKMDTCKCRMKARGPGLSLGGTLQRLGMLWGPMGKGWMTWVPILASSPGSAQVAFQLQLLTQAAYTPNCGPSEPKATWTHPESLKCSYFSIPWEKAGTNSPACPC